MEYILIFLLPGSAGVITTIILCLTGERTKTEINFTKNLDYIKLFKISISIVTLVYLFRVIMIVFVGIVSEFYIQTLIGGILALVPIIVLVVASYKRDKSKVLIR